MELKFTNGKLLDFVQMFSITNINIVNNLKLDSFFQRLPIQELENRIKIEEKVIKAIEKFIYNSDNDLKELIYKLNIEEFFEILEMNEYENALIAAYQKIEWKFNCKSVIQGKIIDENRSNKDLQIEIEKIEELVNKLNFENSELQEKNKIMLQELKKLEDDIRD